MKQVTKDVKTTKIVDGVKKQVKVGDVTVDIYENIDELIANVKPEVILGMFNKANVIRLQGNERAKHQDAKAGKTKRRGLAYNLLSPEELGQYAGKFAELQEFLDSDEMQVRVDESIAASE